MDRIKCPCCGQTFLEEEFDICEVCGWEYDLLQLDDPDYAGGANDMSLNEARIAYREGRKVL